MAPAAAESPVPSSSPAPEASVEEAPVDAVAVAASTKIADLCDSRADLLGRIQSLKKDLQEWRGKLDTQVKNYRQELGDLKNTLNLEVEQLKSEFQDLRQSLRKQLDEAATICPQIPDFDKQVEESVPDLLKKMDLNKNEEADS